MLDIRWIRENSDAVRKNMQSRQMADRLAWVDEALELDAQYRKLKGDTDALRSRRNTLSMEINAEKKAGKDAQGLILEAQELPKKIASSEEQLNSVQDRLRHFMLRIPNMLHESVPVGKDSTENPVIHEFGKPKTPSFELKGHTELLQALNGADLERAAKVAGARWYYLKGKVAQLEQALCRYGIDFMVDHGYTLVIPPHMMNRAAYEGVVDMGAFEDALYKVEGEDLYLIATSEHPLTAQYKDEVLSDNELPMRLTGFSTNFRKEAGAHGKDQKGIFRVHQFNKVEQVVFARPEDSWKLHEELVKNAVEFWKTLEMPFHQITLCSGDTGTVMAKTYDYEAWYPVQQAYREVGSCSNATDYQARRLNIRYQKGEERPFVHTLNATLVATTRAVVAILENFQQSDGSVKIPKALQKYTGFKEIVQA
ncbi:serine--tRNA ligase [Candidatus Woesearchaeota archaeon]|nr:serine--tRNA ligase [Candidatus Woesearchaeota archaeon]